ncbi:tetratricopeptide repeat protein [Pirellulaceae bacterium SH501]
MKFKDFVQALSVGLRLGGIGFAFAMASPSCYGDSGPGAGKSVAGKSGAGRMEERIEELIQMLADPSYSKRQNARAELERIGVVALDRLHAASFDADPQIASSARFIVRSNQFNWAWEYDSPRVREILNNFGAAETYEKSVYIDELARLERDEGLAALCRLARYETVGALAKKAAIHVLKSKPLVGQSQASRSEKILRYIEGGNSNSSLWIQHQNSGANARSFDADWWIQQIENERTLIGKNTQETSVDVAVELTKWVAQQLSLNPDTRAKAIQVAQKLLEPSLNQSLHRQSQLGQQSAAANVFAQWALQLQLPELVHEQHKLLPTRIISREPIFTYYLAESYLQLGDKEKAERIALAALNSKELEKNPLDWKGEPLSPANANDQQNATPGLDAFSLAYRNRSAKENSYVLGKTLADRGRFEWAERELKQAAGDDLTLDSSLMALFKLAEIQQSLGKHEEAKLTLEPFVQRLEKEPMFRRQMVEQSQLLTYIVTSYHQYAGDAARIQNNIGEAARQYILSLDSSEENVDALIGLYKLETGPELQAKRRDRLRATVTRMKDGIRKYDQFLREGAGNDYFQTFSLQLANELNSLAWLIANTEGDFGEAILMSRRACSLNPDHAEYLDTLAHCYFAAGKWKDAVEQQQRALSLKPNHPDFQRALSRFQAKLAEAETTSAK